MEHLTTDPSDSRLGHGIDEKPIPQHEVYLVLSDEELAKGYVRPFRRTYKHLTCGATTTMGETLAATYARDPKFYSSTYCVHCQMHKAVDEFVWDGTNEKVGS